MVNEIMMVIQVIGQISIQIKDLFLINLGFATLKTYRFRMINQGIGSPKIQSESNKPQFKKIKAYQY